MNVFFDVQGTLISGGRPRPRVREVFLELAEMGHHPYLWSSGGGGYAAVAARQLGIEDIVFGCFSKFAALPVSVDFVVDDQRDFAESRGGYTIPPFDGDPNDDELWKVVERLRD
ncbi:hypothetical protein BH18ACT10_BH18ACT10_00560 [soil metagenome]|nr:hypothetical protein [Rubrobacter sp.]